jgi:hypothetical protein
MTAETPQEREAAFVELMLHLRALYWEATVIDPWVASADALIKLGYRKAKPDGR